jgi:hypothetical protein
MSDLSYLFECEVFFVVVYISMLNVGLSAFLRSPRTVKNKNGKS